MRISRLLYGTARAINKAASITNRIETYMTGDPEKIVKYEGRRQVYKASNAFARKVNKFLK